MTVEPEETEESGQADFRDATEQESEPLGQAAAQPWLAEPLNAGEQEVVDGDVLQEMEAPQPVVDGEAEPLEARYSAASSSAACRAARPGRPQDR